MLATNFLVLLEVLHIDVAYSLFTDRPKDNLPCNFDRVINNCVKFENHVASLFNINI